MNLHQFICKFVAVLIFAGFGAESHATELTTDLHGTDITYHYSSGRQYNVKFTAGGASYRYLSGSKPNLWWGPFPYQAIQVEQEVYFLSWFEQGYGDYVTLLVNFNEKSIHGSAILRGEEVHFHKAQLVDWNRPSR